MARAHIRLCLCLSTLTVLNLFQLLTSALSATFTITNNCNYTAWPGIRASLGSDTLQTTGFVLPKGESHSVATPTSWSGRLWGRTLCSSDTSGYFYCETGDCGTSNINCSSSVTTPPATLAEFTLNTNGGMDYYDISLVDGYNLPMLVVPHDISGKNCNGTGCSMDLNLNCPSELTLIKSNQSVACKSPCQAFGSPEYCCTGQYVSANTCKPSSYSQLFKKACPTAYSYAYDDSTSNFTCAGADYLITFCPNATSLQAYKTPTPAPVPPMVFIGGNDDNKNHQDSFAMPSSTAPAILVLVASWLLIHWLVSA